MWRKSVLSLNKEGASFTLKITLFYLEKRQLLGVGILGEQAPPPPDVPLQGIRGNEKGSRGQFTGSAPSL